MRVLFIGGTGNISTAVSRLAVSRGIELFLCNRGERRVDIDGARKIRADINDKATVHAALGDMRFDSVVDWVAFEPRDIERDMELFGARTKQFVFISSASAYEKPPRTPIVTESTPLKNPYWQYSRDKIACEDLLVRAYRDLDFSGDDRTAKSDLRFGAADSHWWMGMRHALDRLKAGREIIVHGDGTSLWTVTHAEDFAKGFVPLLGHP